MGSGLIAALLHRLEQLGPLTPSERESLQGLPWSSAQHHAGGQVLTHEGDRPAKCMLILSGYACRHRLLEDGKRQIISFNLSGDLLDLTSLLLGRLDHSAAALTAVTVATIAHDALLNALECHPGLTRALWRNSLVDAAAYREWVVNNSGRPAYQRIAHLFCEVVTRMQMAGLLPALEGGRPCELPPVTQSDLADATGLSMVHINRTLRLMRLERLVAISKRTVVVLNWPALQRVAEFDPAYLHCERP